MLQVWNHERIIPFMRWKKWTSLLSLTLIAIALTSISIRWFNWGLDFTGGTLVEVTFPDPAELDEVREVLHKHGYTGASVQHFGSTRDVLIRFRLSESNSDELSNAILHLLEENLSQKVTMQRIEFVGPNVGKELAEAGGLAIVVALVCILAYVSMRFEWRLATGAVLALIHDVIITLGIFSLLQIEIDLTIIAALLTVVGYSLNDTIVVFDRIRENFLKMRKGNEEDVINSATSQTLSRTLVTSMTTLLVVIALLSLGGSLIFGFAIALFMGLIIGTYSSIYVAAALALQLGLTRESIIPPVVEKEGLEEEL